MMTDFALKAVVAGLGNAYVTPPLDVDKVLIHAVGLRPSALSVCVLDYTTDGTNWQQMTINLSGTQVRPDATVDMVLYAVGLKSGEFIAFSSNFLDGGAVFPIGLSQSKLHAHVAGAQVTQFRIRWPTANAAGGEIRVKTPGGV